MSTDILKYSQPISQKDSSEHYSHADLIVSDFITLAVCVCVCLKQLVQKEELKFIYMSVFQSNNFSEN